MDGECMYAELLAARFTLSIKLTDNRRIPCNYIESDTSGESSSLNTILCLGHAFYCATFYPKNAFVLQTDTHALGQERQMFAAKVKHKFSVFIEVLRPRTTHSEAAPVTGSTKRLHKHAMHYSKINEDVLAAVARVGEGVGAGALI